LINLEAEAIGKVAMLAPFITGAEFNATNTRKLLKLTSDSACHNGFTFREGLNIDRIPLNGLSCKAGGLYITFEDCFYLWLDYNGQAMSHIWDVEIPKEAKVFMESGTKVKADMIILTNRRPISELPQWKNRDFQDEALQWNSRAIRFIDVPDEGQCLYVINKSSDNIRYINNPSEDLQLIAIRRDGFAIQFLDNPSYEVQMGALRYDPATIQYIKDPSPDHQLIAVKSNGLVIKYLPKAPYSVKLEAVKQNGLALAYIKDADYELTLVAARQNRRALSYAKDAPTMIYQLEQEEEAIKRNRRYFRSMKDRMWEATWRQIAGGNLGFY